MNQEEFSAQIENVYKEALKQADLIVAKAEKVRSAQLNLIKAKLVLLIPYISEDVSEMKMLNTLKLNNEYREWERKSVEEIIDGYR